MGCIVLADSGHARLMQALIASKRIAWSLIIGLKETRAARKCV